jgi:uroporphyrinogen decarboxylase
MWKVIVSDVHETGYVFDAIKLTKEMLNDEVPLIGCWFTLDNYVCYAVEGQGSKSLKPKDLFFHPEAAHVLLQKITDTLYIYKKSKAGVDAVQIFDSWGGMLSPVDYQNSLGNTSIRLSKLWQIMLQ